MSARGFRDTLPKLRRREPIGAGLGRVVRECVVWAGKGDPVQIDAAVHKARRALKRARAVLRLAEDLGVAGAKVAQRRLARIGRELSPRRDAAVVAKMAGRVGEKLRDRAPAGVSPGATRAGAADRLWWTRWRKTLAAELRRLDRIDWGRPTAAAVQPALALAAKRVRQWARAARTSGDVASVHEWRKAVIVLREQMLVVKARLAPRAGAAALASRLHDLASRLGEVMDCHVFEIRMRGGEVGPARAGRARLEKFARKRERRALRRARRAWPKLKRQLRRRMGGW